MGGALPYENEAYPIVIPHVRLSLAADCESLAGQLRPADLKELQAHKVTPEVALRVGYEASTPCYTVEHEGEAIAMFGVSPLTVGVPEGAGAVWLLGSDRIKDISYLGTQEMDSDKLTDSQYTQLCVFRILGWYMFPALSK